MAKSQRPDDNSVGSPATEEIVAYLDGELDPKTAEDVAARLSRDPKLRAMADSLQRTWDVLDILPRPEPSASFATRTLSQAIPIRSGPTAVFQAPSTTTMMTLPRSRPGMGFWLASAAMILAAAGLGYFVHRELIPVKPSNLDPSLDDVSLMKNLHLYRYIDDLDYLKRLDSPEMFANDVVGTASQDQQSVPEDSAYLRRQSAWFQAQDSRRQQQLRRLHTEFQQLDPGSRTRLTQIMQIYNAWLGGLPPADHERVLNAPDSAARLEVVHSLREHEWIESLPKPYREEYAKLDQTGRQLKVQEWRTEDAERREEWAIAQRHWVEHPGGKVPDMFNSQHRPLVDAFVGHLRENLNEAEKRDLEDARVAADEYGNFLLYGLVVVRLADRHPILPGAVGPKDFESLPNSVRSYILRNDPQDFRPKGVRPSSPDFKEVQRSRGRWPDFAVELTRLCQKRNLKLPMPLGDCRKDQMPPEVKQFLDKSLEPQLRRTEIGKSELEALRKAQGSWPEYPRMIMDLARKYKMPIPGWTLPGPQRDWERLRAGKQRAK